MKHFLCCLSNRVLLNIFLLCITAICQLQCQPETPEKLSFELADKACKATQMDFQSFYENIRESQGMVRRYPPWPERNVTDVPGSVLNWQVEGDYIYLYVYYDGILSDFAANPSLNFSHFTWCIYLFSTSGDIHGCIRDDMKWGTPEFQFLGLLDKMYLVDLSAQFGLRTGTIPSFNIRWIDFDTYSMGNRLWHNAMITANIIFDNTSSLGEYYIMNSHRAVPQYISETSTQADSFLIEGVNKTFHCDILGGVISHVTTWFSGGTNRTFLKERFTSDKNHDSITYRTEFIEAAICNQYNNRESDEGTNRMLLEFFAPTRNVTGVYTCAVFRGTQQLIQHRSIYVYIVYTEIPNDILVLDKRGELSCELKAPINSNVSVLHNGDRLGGDAGRVCDHVPWVSSSVRSIDEDFSLYHVLIHICRVSDRNVGRYECQVSYNIPTTPEAQLTSITVDVTVVTELDEKVTDSGLSAREGAGIGIGVMGMAVMLILVITISLVFFVKFLHQKSVSSRIQKLQQKNVLIAAVNTLFLTVDVNSPGTPPSGYIEFPRKKLKLHQEIGKGRFGRVMKASADGIVPHLPNVNIVAVKIALTNNSQSQESMAAELMIMKKIEAHANICNLLAYCSENGPVYIIMEYACHGNLKKHLHSCRQAVLQAKKPLCLTDKDKNGNYGFYLNISDAVEKPPKTSHPGLISEADVCKYASQIANGLEHLHNLGILHCDLAARNILISEGFVLKISDFGMTRTASDDENYHEIIDVDGIIAIKWAAPEALENKGYFFKSDVWSYGVVMWEIASYGAEPFSDFRIGVSLNKFIQHLRNGNRLPKPDGLSDSVYHMMLNCWMIDSDSRPSSSALKDAFQNGYYNQP